MNPLVLKHLQSQSVLHRFQERMSTALAPVEMTKIRDDPYVHFGDVLQLVHVKTGCLLAVDVEDKVRDGLNNVYYC